VNHAGQDGQGNAATAERVKKAPAAGADGRGEIEVFVTRFISDSADERMSAADASRRQISVGACDPIGRYESATKPGSRA
jgi:hypothetical protein